MSTLHVSGVAALIKQQHPKWSPTMIMSTITKTADVTAGAVVEAADGAAGR